MSLKTDQLRYFVTVAEEGQITRAAKKLYIAQPALSQAIAQLESELGLQLLERHARGVRLTPAGAAFLEKARAVVDTERAVSLTAESLARAARGMLEVGFIGPPPPLIGERAVHRVRRSRTPTARSRSASCRSRAASTRRLARDRRRRPLSAARPSTRASAPSRSASSRARCVVSSGHPLADAGEVRMPSGARRDLHQLPARRAAGVGRIPQPRRPSRRARPAAITADHVATSLEMLGRLAVIGDAVTALPLSDARLIEQVLPGVRALPILDAAAASISLVWAREASHPRLQSLLDCAAAGTGADAGDGRRRERSGTDALTAEPAQPAAAPCSRTQPMIAREGVSTVPSASFSAGSFSWPVDAPQLLARAFAQERDRAAVRRHDLVVLDPGVAQRFLDAPARMNPRTSFVAVAHVERRLLGHPSPRLVDRSG